LTTAAEAFTILSRGAERSRAVTGSSIVHVSAAAVLLVLGCDAGTRPPADAFAGTWTFAFGSIGFDHACIANGGIYVSPILLTGDTMTITKDDDTDVTATFGPTGATCDVGFTVSRPTASLLGDPTATVKPGQTCSISLDPVPGTFQIESGGLDFYSNPYGKMLELTLAGGFVPTGYATTTCSVNVVGRFPIR
jgi:hypothetical protein